MSRFLLRWIVLAVAVIVSSMLAQMLGLGFEAKVDDVSDFLKLMLGVAVLSLLNATLGKVLKLLTMPLNCLTLGLFSLVVNAVVLMIAASLKLGFEIEGEGFQAFVTALVASLLISFIASVLGTVVPDNKADDE